MKISEKVLKGWVEGGCKLGSYTGIMWFDYDGKPLWSKTVLDTPEKTVITETIYKKNING
jgi:hypothetical protein